MQHKVLRGWCVQLTNVLDTNNDEGISLCTQKIQETLELLTKEEQQEVLQDTDLKGFLESFGEFKKFIKE
jgi:hypothetical protein